MDLHYSYHHATNRHFKLYVYLSSASRFSAECSWKCLIYDLYSIQKRDIYNPKTRISSSVKDVASTQTHTIQICSCTFAIHQTIPFHFVLFSCSFTKQGEENSLATEFPVASLAFFLVFGKYQNQLKILEDSIAISVCLCCIDSWAWHTALSFIRHSPWAIAWTPILTERNELRRWTKVSKSNHNQKICLF